MSATFLFGLEHARGLVDRAEFHRTLDELLDVREQSDPHAPTAPEAISFREARGKDEVARHVAATARLFMLQVAGWPINHIIGRALEEQSGNEIDTNSHELESKGQDYAAEHCEQGDENAERERAVLRGLTDPTICLIPAGLAWELQHALSALKLGETLPLLTPSETQFQGAPYTLAQLRLVVLEHVYFQRGKGGKGFTKDEALADVANGLGVDPRRILGWQTVYLRKFFSKQTIKERTTAAKVAGRLPDILSKDPTSAVRFDRAVGTCYDRLHDPSFSLKSLKERLAAAETKQSAARKNKATRRKMRHVNAAPPKKT